MLTSPRRETYWYITEMGRFLVDTQNQPRMHSFSVANSRPRVLRWLTEPHLATHRIVEARRQRVASGPTGVRLVLESFTDPRRQIILHALIITLSVAG